MTEGAIWASSLAGPDGLTGEVRELLKKSVTWVFIPTRRSCPRRNDGVKAVAFDDLFRVSLAVIRLSAPL